MTLLSSSPQHCLKGEGGEIKIILDCFQIVYYDLTISLNIFCEGLLLTLCYDFFQYQEGLLHAFYSFLLYPAP